METLIQIKLKEDKKGWITLKEFEIIKKMSHGKSSKEIASEMGSSIKTIEVHRHNILKKTGCLNVAHLIATALRQKLIE